MNNNLKNYPKLLNIFLDTTAVGALLFKEGIVVFANDYICNLLGYRKEDIVGKSATDIFGDTNEFIVSIKTIAQEGSKKESAFIHLSTSNGKLKHFECFIYKIDEDELKIFAVLIDRTKLKQLEMLYSALLHINDIIAKETNEIELLKGICKVLVKDVGYFLASFGKIDKKIGLFKPIYAESLSEEAKKALELSTVGVDPAFSYGRGTASEAYRTKKVVVKTSDDPDLAYWKDILDRFGISSVSSIPICKGSNVEYILFIHDRIKSNFDESYHSLLERIQRNISYALEKIEEDRILKEKEKALEFEQRIYNTLYHISKAVLESKTEEELIGTIPEILVKHLGVDLAFVSKIIENKVEFSSVYANSQKLREFTDFVKHTFDDSREGVVRENVPFYRSFIRRRAYIINDLIKLAPEPFRDYHAKIGLRSCCSIPLIVDKEVVYGISLISRKKNLFTKRVYNMLLILQKELNHILKSFEDQKFTRLIENAINSGFDFVVIMDKDFNIVYANENTLSMFRYIREEVMGKHHSIFSSHTHSKSFTRNFYNTLKSGKPFYGVIAHKTKEDKIIKTLVNIVPYKLSDNEIYYISTGRDITQHYEIQKALEDGLRRDPVTGLQTRHAFLESVERFIARAKKENLMGAVCVINPIRFRHVNQAFDFETGNFLLKEIGRRIESGLREYDVTAKIESDKFAVLIKDIRREEDIFSAVFKLLNRVSKPYIYNDQTINLIFNAGVSIFPKDGDSPDKLLQRAEIALLNAKETNESIGFYKEDFKKQAQQILKLKSEIPNAIKNKEFVLYFQPYFNARTHKIVGAEALIRWKKNDKLIPPLEFIPYLEKIDMITLVEEWVTEEVARLMGELDKRGYKKVPISINISPKNFMRRTFLDDFLSKVKSLEIDPNLLNIEIVERMFLYDVKRAKFILTSLKEAGFSISIDDFGTGYSSLSYLASLPVDVIKIDISFVRKIISDPNTKAIVKAVISLSKELKMATIAEGVEEKEQLDVMEGLGVDHIQGYYFSRPLPFEEFIN